MIGRPVRARLGTRRAGWGAEGAVLYFWAMVAPPLAVLLTGRKTAALLNAPLTLAGWLPGVLHAVLVVNEYKADQRARRYCRADGRGEVREPE